jgi:hypothetical protein
MLSTDLNATGSLEARFSWQERKLAVKDLKSPKLNIQGGVPQLQVFFFTTP